MNYCNVWHQVYLLEDLLKHLRLRWTWSLEGFWEAGKPEVRSHWGNRCERKKEIRKDRAASLKGTGGLLAMSMAWVIQCSKKSDKRMRGEIRWSRNMTAIAFSCLVPSADIIKSFLSAEQNEVVLKEQCFDVGARNRYLICLCVSIHWTYTNRELFSFIVFFCLFVSNCLCI